MQILWDQRNGARFISLPLYRAVKRERGEERVERGKILDL